jgi:hypothetical protein
MTPRTALNPISSAAQSICSAGTADTIVLDLIVLRRRGLLRHAWVLVLTPLHWFGLSLAAWRARTDPLMPRAHCDARLGVRNIGEKRQR